MPRIDPEVEVEVLDDGEWRRGFAYFRQQLDDGWWYSPVHTATAPSQLKPAPLRTTIAGTEPEVPGWTD